VALRWPRHGAALILCGLFVALLHAPCHAIRYEDIPPETRRRLPEFVLRIANPQALAALSLADIEEFADAYEENRLRFVNEVRVEGSGGPLSPDLALLILQIPEGAPFVEARFVRLAKQAYGSGIFSNLEWEIHENADTSVDILLWYGSNDPSGIAPDVGISGLAGILAGVQYYDLYAGGEDKQINAGVQLSEKFTDEPRIYGSYADNTLNGGDNGYSVAASVGNDYRTRLDGPSRADLRARVWRLDGTYSWNDAGPGNSRVTVGAGVYDQSVEVLAGDPTAGGTVPFDQEGTGEYVSVRLSKGERDHLFTPKKGYSVSVTGEKHVGDFDFARISADARRYIPAPNILGIKPDQPDQWGGRNDIKRFFPAASFALQAQASFADGHVPYTEEIYVGGTTTIRGYPGSTVVGTQFVGLRGEYRFALDRNRDREAFVFTDHALIGDSIDDMESLSTVGAGALLRLPIYGGIKLGGYYGRALDGSESSYGIALGYQF
jgi:outer membrane protein assembly factor BamA